MNNHCFITSLHKDEEALLKTSRAIEDQLDKGVFKGNIKFSWVIKCTLSTDVSSDTFSEWAHNDICNILVIKTRDNGIYDAWNQAISSSVKATSYSFIGAGDTPNLEWTQRATQHLLEYPMVFGDQLITTVSGRKIRLKQNNKVHWKNKVPHSLPVIQAGMIFSSKFLNDDNNFDSSFRVVGDWEWIYRNKSLDAKYEPGVHIVFPLGGMSNGAHGISQKIQETGRMREMIGRKMNLREFRFYIDFCLFWFLAKISK